MMWAALVGAGAITIAFSFLFGTQSATAQIVMSAGLAFTIALVMLAIIALEQPFAGISRISPQTFEPTGDRIKATRSRWFRLMERTRTYRVAVSASNAKRTCRKAPQSPLMTQSRH